MGLCSSAWEKLSAMMGSPFSKPQVRVIKAKAKCPKCGEEFTVDVEVQQNVAGSINSFSAWSGQGSILSQCPWQIK